MKFPVTIRHRASKAKICAPAGKFTYCRVAYNLAGKRKMQTFEEVKLLLTELHKDWKLAQIGKHELFEDSSTVLFWLVAVSVGKETGLRLSDIAQLQWRSFQEAGKLVAWPRKPTGALQCPSPKGCMPSSPKSPCRTRTISFPTSAPPSATSSAALACPCSSRASSSGWRFGTAAFHSLRHYKATHAFAKMDKATLAAKLVEALSMEQIAALLGHASAKSAKHYLH